MPLRTFRLVFFLIILSQSLVAQTTSAVSLFGSPNPSVYGAAVTVTATVTPSAATGHVTFYDGAAVLGVSSISGGQAMFTTRLLGTGARSLHAHYSGDTTYAPSDSAIVTQTVNSVAAASFSPAVNYPISLGAGSVASGDFNRDGKTDLAVCSSTVGDSLTIFLGNGDGTFQQFATYTVSFPSSVAVGDLNNDGIPDLVTYSGSGITVWIGNGDGNFTEGHTYGSFPPGSGVQLADFNGDGNVDALTDSNFDLQIWWGNGDGTLTAGPVLTLPENGSPVFVVGDFNGDGKADIASMGIVAAASSFVVFLGNGDGTFTPVAESNNAPVIGYRMAAGDLNNNGKLDLVLATGDDSVSVLLGNGDGTFQSAVKYKVATNSYGVAIADFNGDGKPDIAVADSSSNEISVLAGNGDGTFQGPTSYATGGGAGLIALGDFNGDGRVDAAVGAETGGSVLLGNAAAPPTVEAVSVSPASGTGSSQTFTFEFTDSAGATDIASLSMMIGSPATRACAVTYTRATNSLALVPSGVASSTTMANYDCTIQLAQSGLASPAGTMQSFNLAVSFNGTMKGTQTVSGLATSASGATTGWQPLGTWTVPPSTLGPATAVSVAPASGAGMTQTFLFTYVDPSGPGDLVNVWAAIGNPSGPGSCVVEVTPNNNAASLTQGAGYFGVGPSALGSQGTLQSGQCSLNLANSGAVWSGNTFAISLSLTFAASYSGPQNISAEAGGVSVIGPGWQALGSWTVASTPVPGPCSVVTGSTIPMVTDVQQMIDEALGIAAPNHDLNGDGVVNIADVQTVIQAALGRPCLY